MNQFIVDRIQTAGANLNVPEERVYELGNFQSVAVVRDVPDLTFTLECLDVSCEVEALLTGSTDPSGDLFGTDGLTGTVYSLADNKPVDIISPFKSAQGAYDIVKGVAVPQLSLESASYRYGLRQNASESFTLRGDSIFYVPGTPFVQTEVADGSTATFAFASDDATPQALTALLYQEQGEDIYALNVSVDGVRQVRGVHYTDTNADVTFGSNYVPAAGALVRIVFGIAVSGSTRRYYNQSVHEGTSVKPAAIRGKDIKVYVGETGATPLPFLWGDVQSVNVDYRVTLEDDYEFGNPRAVARDYANAPDVTGSIELKPITPAALFDKLQQITGVPSNQIVGAQSSVTLPLRVELLNPDSGGTSAYPAGTVLKTLYIPDARFTVPGYEGRAQQKLVQTLNFTSDGGILDVFSGKAFGV